MEEAEAENIVKYDNSPERQQQARPNDKRSRFQDIVEKQLGENGFHLALNLTTFFILIIISLFISFLCLFQVDKRSSDAQHVLKTATARKFEDIRLEPD